MLLLVFVMSVGVASIAKARAFSVDEISSDGILVELVLPNLDIHGISYHVSTVGKFNGDLWLLCALYLDVVED